MKKTNKKADTIKYFISVIIAIISFMIIYWGVFSNLGYVSTEGQNLLCRGTIEAKSNELVKVGEEISKKFSVDSFLNDVVYTHCPVERLIIKNKNKEETFKEIADSSARCFFRYGEAENDFLSPFETSGNWCFICGTIEIEDDNQVSYDYKDFISYLKKTDYKELENGTKLKYSDYIQIKFTDVNHQDLQEIELEIQDILSDKDPALTGVAGLVLGQYEALADLKLKKINTNEPTYIIYRYDRLDKSFTDKMEDGTIGAAGAIFGSIFVGSIVESAVTFGLGFPVSVIKNIGKSITSYKKIIKIEETSRKISNLIRKTKKIDSLKDLSYYTYKGKKFLKIDDLSKFSMSRSSMLKIADELDNIKDAQKLGYSQKATNLRTIASWMKDMNIDDIKDIEKLEFSKQDDLQKLYKLFDNGIDSDVISDDILNAYIKKEGKLNTEIGDYNALRELLVDELKSGIPDTSTKTEIIDYIRVAVLTGIGATGSYIATEFNQEFSQYIDIMTQEQYFRLCGTEKKINERLN